MALLTTDDHRDQASWRKLRRSDDSPAPAAARRAEAGREALFDIADFQAIAAFAGIRPQRPREQ